MRLGTWEDRDQMYEPAFSVIPVANIVMLMKKSNSIDILLLGISIVFLLIV